MELYKCLTCGDTFNKRMSNKGVQDGHCRLGDLTLNNNDIFWAIENAQNISAEIVQDDRQTNSNMVGCEYHIVLWPYQTKKRVGSRIRYGKYIAKVIDNERMSSSNHKIRIVRELTDFEKLILIIRKNYRSILYSLSYLKRNSLMRELYPKSFYDTFKYIVGYEIRSIKYSIKNEDFSYRYDKR
jgi:hypothetical protein